MITKTTTTQNGISYWTTTGDDADNILTGSALSEGTYRDMLIGGAGDDTLRGGSGSDTLDGGDGQDKLYGGSGSNSLTGGAGNDVLDGSGGNDTVNGGAGNDVIAGGDDNDLLIQQDWFGTDRFDGGRGTDTIDYSGSPPGGSPPGGAATDGAAPHDTSVHVSLATGTVIKYLDGVESATDTIRNVDLFIVTAFNDTLDGNSGANMLEGRLGNDVLNGGGGNDTLYGDFGANFLSLNDTVGGDDTLSGGVGNDSLFGGAGNDLFVQDSALGGDKIDGGLGSDTVDYGQLDSAGIVANLATGKVFKYANGYQRGVDTLSNIETLIATDLNDTLTGGSASDSDSLAGGGGNDYFSMLIGTGSNTLDGGSGLDTLDYGQSAPAGATVAVDMQAGTVSKYQGGQLIGVDTITNMENFIVTSGADTFIGGDNNDVLDGGAGNDVINGGAGNDDLNGGLGLDTLDYSTTLQSGTRIAVDLVAGAGTKMLNGAVTGVDQLANLEHVIGTSYNDTLYGRSNAETLDGGNGDDILDGRGGSDLLSGGAGNDTIVRSSVLTGASSIDGGLGTDTVDYSQVAEAGVRVQFISFVNAIDKYVGNVYVGSDAIIDIEKFILSQNNDFFVPAGWDRGGFVVDGQAGNDTLGGSPGSDSMAGGDGDDLIIGGISEYGGKDTLDGGAGIDTLNYYNNERGYLDVDLAAGKIVKHSFDGGNNTDLVRNFEVVVGTENNDVLNGSDKSEVLQGGDGQGSDTLNGRGGNDSLGGGGGNDRIIQDDLSGNDTIDGGAGTDTLDYSALFAQGANIKIDLAAGTVTKYRAGVAFGTDAILNIENFIGTGRNDTIIGNADDNVLNGGKGNDVLNGGDGNDVLNGGTGNDALNGGNGDDRFIQGSAAADTTIDGGLGNDTLDYSQLKGGISANFAAYWDGSARTYIGIVEKHTGSALAGTDTFLYVDTLIATPYNDTLTGGADPVMLQGQADNDVLVGGWNMNDTLFGGSGNDTLSGSANMADQTDSMAGDDGDDVFAIHQTYGNETMDGGSGFDTVDYSDLNPFIDHGLVVDLAAGTAFRDHGGWGGHFPDTDLLRNIEGVRGSWLSDVLTGDDKDNVLRGYRNDDTLNGASGNDKLFGDTGDDLIVQNDAIGNDTIDGGDGNDTLQYDVSLTIKVDMAHHKVSKYQGNVVMGVDTFQNIENIVGTLHAATSSATADAPGADNVAATDGSQLNVVGIPGAPVSILHISG